MPSIKHRTPARRWPALLLGSCVWLGMMQAQAAQVYRCGKVYQDQPCAEGQPQAEIRSPVAPTQQERIEAERRAQSEAALAQRMVSERQARERAAAAAAQTTPVALSQPHASLQEDDTLTRCTGSAKERQRWTQRKREHCATRQPVPPRARKRQARN